jgi:hypothetical protein
MGTNDLPCTSSAALAGCIGSQFDQKLDFDEKKPKASSTLLPMSRFVMVRVKVYLLYIGDSKW